MADVLKALAMGFLGMYVAGMFEWLALRAGSKKF
jgi:hypothetical protein